ncbi:MAG: hypothetical protein JSS66_00770 [Armatimonadetes bacterium]|nr:hypothetical protein [Armatimonadota bacterium]
MRQQALQELLRSLEADDLDTETFSAESRSFDDWIGSVSTVPFLSNFRVSVVRSIGRLDLGKRWDAPLDKKHPGAAVLGGLPESARLILVHDEDAGDEDRQNKLKRQSDAWGKLVGLAGGKVLNFNIDASKTADLIRSTAKAQGKKISTPAVNALAEMVGGKPSNAVQETEKLALYVGEAAEIQEADVRAAATPDQEYNVFKLLDAIVAGNSGQAVIQTRTLFGQTGKIEDKAMGQVLPVITGNLRQIWQARFLMDCGVDPARPAPSELDAWMPQKRLSSEPDWRKNRIVGAAKRLSLGKLTQCVEILVRAEAELKGSLPNYSGGESLERMALMMSRVCSSR